jgi:hypothetical protein
MEKKLLLVVTTNPTLSSRYADAANKSPGIDAKALYLANGLSTLLLLLEGRFSDADGVLLSPDTLHVFDRTPEDIIRQIRETKPSIRILILRIGGLMKKYELEQRMIAAGADGIYVGIDPSMNDFHHWIASEMDRLVGTRGRIYKGYKGNLRQQSARPAKPAVKTAETISSDEDLDDFAEDDVATLLEEQEVPIAAVRRPYPSPDRKRRPSKERPALSAIDTLRERRDGTSWLFKVPPQSSTKHK